MKKKSKLSAAAYAVFRYAADIGKPVLIAVLTDLLKRFLSSGS